MYRKEVVAFNKNVHFFFSVGYSVVAINHVVEFKDKKQVKFLKLIITSFIYVYIVIWKLQMSILLCTSF